MFENRLIDNNEAKTDWFGERSVGPIFDEIFKGKKFKIVL